MEYLDKFAVNFWANITKGETEDDCWKWKGAKHHGGYGNISIRLNKGRRNEYRKIITVIAHRVSYTIHIGEIPKGLFILHSCDNPECCNPKHLRAGTHADNMKDIWIKTMRKKYSNDISQLDGS